ncbi:hypothetical protein DYU05_15605 [Mucilaginibacter terrenus]|uniref:Uncharacterized protein n=1 Tax=Mucilaginibacter terrenus TaxID=2482727 RepID=A0A3E2NM21_9SPHI|nr:hypothetical protein [Mucilaginibacter terrenus]RFZ82054.1 hypothetical protein DYU05_15605 [Mucilaginibacter terrenus]
MKRPALLVFGTLLIIVVSIYFIIPQYITATSVVSVDATDVNVARFLVDQHQWPKWWPGKVVAGDSVYEFNGNRITITNAAAGYVDCDVNTGNDVLKCKVSYQASGEGATNITWKAAKQSSLNPITRISEYFRIKKENTELEKILKSFKKFIQTDVNVYGLKIKLSKVKDGTMLATSTSTTTYPDMAVIYNLIDGLHKQISAAGANESNKPMLNINQVDEKEYHTMVAVPINKEVQPDQKSVINKMVVGGNLLETETKGGRGAINNAFTQLKRYQKDHGLISPAMPYEVMMNNRLMEKDTAKWVTKVYWPIF